MDSLISLEARDQHVDVAGANVLTVQFIASLLTIVLRVADNIGLACFPPEALLEVNVVL